MAIFTCDKCGNTVTYLINDVCQNCFAKEPDYNELLDASRERETERKVRQSENMTRDFINREREDL